MSYNPAPNFGFDPFQALAVAEKRTDIYSTPIYGTSSVRHVISEVSGARIYYDGREFVLTTSNNANSEVLLQTKRRSTYVPGFQSTAGIGFRLGDLPRGSQFVRWGLFDSADGFGFGYDSTGSYIFVVNSGSETIVRQGDWNVDTRNGSNTNSGSLNFSAGRIFQIKYTWYGYGTLEFSVIDSDDNTAMRDYVPLHRFNPTAGTSVAIPKLPLAVKVSNNSTTASLAAYTCGMGVTVLGDLRLQERTIATYITGVAVSTTGSGIIAVRKASLRQPANVYLSKIKAQSTQDLILFGKIGSTFTGGTFITPVGQQTNETLMQANYNPSTGSGGRLVSVEFLNAVEGKGNDSVIGAGTIDHDLQLIGDNDTYLLEGKSLGAGSSTVNIIFEWIEEW